MAELDPGVILDGIIEIGSCRPHKGKDEDHGATSISIEVRHLVEVLLGTEFTEKDVEDIDAALH